MNVKRLRKIAYISLATLLSMVVIVLAINYFEIKSSSEYVVDVEDKLQQSQVAIIFGAKVAGDMMSPMYADRAVSALNLYNSGKVDKILISGDHGRKDYNEVDVVKDYLILNNVRSEDIFTDYAGFDTYDTLYRAKEIFNVDSAILVTQRFHLYRAVYIAKNLGMNVSGYVADLHSYRGSWTFEAREIFARMKAFFDVMVKSKPKYLGNDIPISGDGRASWD